MAKKAGDTDTLSSKVTYFHSKYTEQKENNKDSIPQRLELLLGVEVEVEESGTEVEKALA